MKKLLLVLVTLTLSSCVQYEWVKPGADKMQEEITETDCQAQALKELPPDNVIIDKYTSKNKKYESLDTTYSTSDANEVQRDILVKNCMYKKGWLQEEVQQ